jgi:PTS system mannitol-specific IIC component
VLLGVLVSTAVSFFIASYFIKRSRNNLNEEDLEGAKYMVKDFKAAPIKKSTKKVIFACDAGMGSSAMGATTLKNKFKKAGLDIEVVHCAVDEIPKDSEIVIVHESLLDRAKAISPNAEHIGIKNFMDDPEYDLLIKRLS